MLSFCVPVVLVWRVSFGYSDSIRFGNSPLILHSYNSKLEPTDDDRWQKILEEASLSGVVPLMMVTMIMMTPTPFFIPGVSLRHNQAACPFK
jgi:hypothetical protein